MKFKRLNFEESFGEKSKGRDCQQVVDTHGNSILSTTMWKAGDDAVKVLFELAQPLAGVEIQNSVNINELKAALSDIELQTNEFLCNDFFPTLVDQVDAGRVALDFDRGSLELHWREADMAWRARIFLEILENNAMALEDPGLLQLVRGIAAICTIARIDDSALALFFDGSGLDEAAIDVGFFHGRVKLPTALFSTISQAKRVALSDAASSKAAKLHAPRNNAKNWVRSEWIEKHEAYGGNKSEFARHYARRIKNERSIEITEKTIREVWLADTPAAGKQAGLPAAG